MNQSKKIQAILMLAEELKISTNEAERLLMKMIDEYKLLHNKQ